MDFPHEVHVEKVSGPIPLESYVAGVVMAENGNAAHAARQAQAVAARTFLLRAIRDDRKLGTLQKPIPSSERFQVYRPNPSQRAIQATTETAGIVCRYLGELIICNYVAGAYWNAGGQPREDPTNTEKWVTYNEGKIGSAVKPTSLSNVGRSDNRGCKSQNGADSLARNGHDYRSILRYFYGADLEIGPLLVKPAAPLPSPPSPPAGGAGSTTSTSSPLPVLAALVVAFIGDK